MKKIIFPLFILLLLQACKKNDIISSPDAQIRISVDSLRFDTVFTNTGSITKSFKIVNENDQRIRLSSIKLMGATASAFHININGTAAPEVHQVEIAAEDSMYVFVTVNVDPGSSNLPFIISDSILVAYNGNERFVQLEAFGQNAHFLRNEELSSNQTWTPDLPYVILGGFKVLPGVVLQIQPGTKIYNHADAVFQVEGSMQAIGTKEQPIVFTGDRLDEPYSDFPASWPGIFFTETSFDNSLHFAEIHNAYQAVVVAEPSQNSNPKLTIQQTIINNAYDVGLLCHNSFVNMNNSLISNSNRNVHIQLGGIYNFINCTFASYSNPYLLHKTPVTGVRNFAEQDGSIFYADLEAEFTNCIFWGSENIVANEIEVLKQGDGLFNVTLSHCIYKAETQPAEANIVNSMMNSDPLFDSIDIQNNFYNFRINQEGAPGINAGISTVFATDLDHRNRTVGITDIGCYEKQ